MPRCPNCRTHLAPPEGQKIFGCETCGASLKPQCDGFRYFSSEIVGMLLFFVLFASDVGPFYALVLGAAAALGLWFWLGRFSLATVPKQGSAASSPS